MYFGHLSIQHKESKWILSREDERKHYFISTCINQVPWWYWAGFKNYLEWKYLQPNTLQSFLRGINASLKPPRCFILYISEINVSHKCNKVKSFSCKEITISSSLADPQLPKGGAAGTAFSCSWNVCLFLQTLRLSHADNPQPSIRMQGS